MPEPFKPEAVVEGSHIDPGALTTYQTVAEVEDERTMFVLDGHGIVTEVLRKVKPTGQDDSVLAALGV